MRFLAKHCTLIRLVITQYAIETIIQSSNYTLSDFLRLSENFEFIPASRIVFVKREGQILYRKYYAGPLK